MYVAVKGGERAIENSLRWLQEARRGDPALPELSVAQVREQLRLAVDRVMAEGSLYDPDLAALALKQARGDLGEALFLVRAFRATLPRLGYSLPLATSRMRLARRISAAFKDLPGGQLLGPTFDYTQRLLDFGLEVAEASAPPAAPPPAPQAPAAGEAAPSVIELLAAEGLVEPQSPADEGQEPPDLTREPLMYPAARAARLQNLARGDEGFLLALGYSTQRGYSHTHPFAGEIRYGTVEVELVPEELGFAVVVGEVELTECQMIHQFSASKSGAPQFTLGYGLAFGQGERKAMAMALVDRALRARELDEAVASPAQMEEFVLAHSDSLEASGFVQHLKLPHYVDFQAELELLRRLRAERREATG
jgi:alpha-D-ribose 1-methylphosphonate 5-triphosphate synthase subunit PhnI